MTTFDDYRRIKAINWSTLKHIDTSPLHYRRAVESTPGPPTDAMVIGTAFHSLTLEPETAADTIAVWTGDRRAGKAWTDFQTENEGKAILRQVDYDKARWMADAVRAHPMARNLLETPDLQVEQTIEFTHRGRKCKSRLDALSVDRHFVLDLKSTNTLDTRAWPAQVARMKYHGQLAFYDLAANPNQIQRFDRVIIACESAEPFDVGVFILDDTARIVGDELVSRLFDRLDECEKSGRWPGRYSDGAEVLSLPHWAVDEDEPDIYMSED